MKIICDKQIFGFTFGYFFVISSYSIIASFFPTWAAQKKQIDQTSIGLIFAFYPIGAAITSLVMAKMMNLWGKSKLIIMSLILMCLSMVSYGLAKFIKNKILFIIISSLSRVITGIGVGQYDTIIYAFIPIIYKEQTMKYMTFLQIADGIGIAFGPTLGGWLFYLQGYLLPFIVFAIIFFVLIFIIAMLIPNQKDDAQQQQLKEQKLPLSLFLCNRKIFLNILLILIQGISFTYMTPTFANYMYSQFNFHPGLIGLIYGIFGISFIKWALLMQFFSKNVPIGFWLILGLLLTSFGLFFLGSFSLIQFLQPKYYQDYFCIIGIYLLGCGQGFVFNAIIPKLIEQSKDIETQYNFSHDRICDIASGLFGFSFNLAELVGPLVGSFLTEKMNFRITSSIIGFSQLVMIIIYLLFADGYKDLQKLLKIQHKQDNLNNLLQANILQQDLIESSNNELNQN